MNSLDFHNMIESVSSTEAVFRVYDNWNLFRGKDVNVLHLQYGVLAEIGEVYGVLVDEIREGYLDKEHLIEELGDVFYYMVLLVEINRAPHSLYEQGVPMLNLIQKHEIDLYTVIIHTLNKLHRRYPGVNTDSDVAVAKIEAEKFKNIML